MKRAGLMAGVALAAVLPQAVAAEGYVCVSGTATAYRHLPESRQWETLVFDIGEHRYRLEPGDEGWSVRRDGEPEVLSCTGDLDEAGFLVCGAGERFRFEWKSLGFSSHWIDEARVPEGAQAVSTTGGCSLSR